MGDKEDRDWTIKLEEVRKALKIKALEETDLENLVGEQITSALDDMNALFEDMDPTEFSCVAYLLKSDSIRFNELKTLLRSTGLRIIAETELLRAGEVTLRSYRLTIMPLLYDCIHYLEYFSRSFQDLPKKAKREAMLHLFFGVMLLAGSVVTCIYLFGADVIATAILAGLGMSGFTLLGQAVHQFYAVYKSYKITKSMSKICEAICLKLMYAKLLLSSANRRIVRDLTIDRLAELEKIGERLTYVADTLPLLPESRSFYDWLCNITPKLTDLKKKPDEVFQQQMESFAGVQDKYLQDGEWVPVDEEEED